VVPKNMSAQVPLGLAKFKQGGKYSKFERFWPPSLAAVGRSQLGHTSTIRVSAIATPLGAVNNPFRVRGIERCMASQEENHCLKLVVSVITFSRLARAMSSSMRAAMQLNATWLVELI
jgi:hypothetical protein